MVDEIGSPIPTVEPHLSQSGDDGDASAMPKAKTVVQRSWRAATRRRSFRRAEMIPMCPIADGDAFGNPQVPCTISHLRRGAGRSLARQPAPSRPHCRHHQAPTALDGSSRRAAASMKSLTRPAVIKKRTDGCSQAFDHAERRASIARPLPRVAEGLVRTVCIGLIPPAEPVAIDVPMPLATQKSWARDLPRLPGRQVSGRVGPRPSASSCRSSLVSS